MFRCSSNMKEVPVLRALHPPAAGWAQRACACSRINGSTKEVVGKLHCCRHLNKLSLATPSQGCSEATCITVSFACLLVGYLGWQVRGSPAAGHVEPPRPSGQVPRGVFLRIHLRDHFWSFSPMGRRLSEQIASSTRDVWSWDHYCAVTTTANAERRPGRYCIRLERFPGSHGKEYENVETEFILSFNISLRKSQPAMEFRGGKSPIKLMAFYSLSVSRWLIPGAGGASEQLRREFWKSWRSKRGFDRGLIILFSALALSKALLIRSQKEFFLQKVKGKRQDNLALQLGISH